MFVDDVPVQAVAVAAMYAQGLFAVMQMRHNSAPSTWGCRPPFAGAPGSDVTIDERQGMAESESRSSHEPARFRPPGFAQNFSPTGAIPPLIPSSFLIDSTAGDGSRRCVVKADIVEKRALLPWRSAVPMFCTEMTLNAIQGCASRCRYEALFDAGILRSGHGFLERDFLERQRIGPPLTGLLGEGRAEGCPAVLGGMGQPDTAGRVQTLVGKAPIPPQVCREQGMFAEPVGAKPRAMGWRPLRRVPFPQRLLRGGAPNLGKVHRIRGWIHAQRRWGQRRAIFAPASAERPFDTAPALNRGTDHSN